MPETHFVGDIHRVLITNTTAVSVTWAIVPGNSAWLLKNGQSLGETQAGLTYEDTGMATINHPIDVQYESASAEGWPLFVCEVWDKSYENDVRGFLGCGCVWMPSNTPQIACEQNIEVLLWRPSSGGLEGLSDMLLASCPDLRSIRELTVSPYLRSQIQTTHVGIVRLRISCVMAGLEEFGVICQ